jgi:hypothetical protein
MIPSHAADAAKEPRNAGSRAVAISWLQSLKSEASAIPSTVRFNHRCVVWESDCFINLKKQVSEENASKFDLEG